MTEKNHMSLRTAFQTVLFMMIFSNIITQTQSICGKGTYSARNGTFCAKCSQGTYCPNEDNADEIICPVGAYCDGYSIAYCDNKAYYQPFKG